MNLEHSRAASTVALRKQAALCKEISSLKTRWIHTSILPYLSVQTGHRSNTVGSHLAEISQGISMTAHAAAVNVH